MDIGIYEAKSRLSRLVEKAMSGEEVILTRHGRPVAKIVRVGEESRRGRAALLREVSALAHRVRIPRKIAVRDLVSEGRD